MELDYLVTNTAEMCPHCHGSMGGSIRHCTVEESHLCDWRTCRTCGSHVVGRRHIHGAKTTTDCRGGR